MITILTSGCLVHLDASMITKEMWSDLKECALYGAEMKLLQSQPQLHYVSQSEQAVT